MWRQKENIEEGWSRQSLELDELTAQGDKVKVGPIGQGAAGIDDFGSDSAGAIGAMNRNHDDENKDEQLVFI